MNFLWELLNLENIFDISRKPQTGQSLSLLKIQDI
jgi:hypothetical protein